MKSKKRAITAILCLALLLSFAGCGTEPRAYKGTPLSSLRFNSVDYFGGYTNSFIFDFDNNTVRSAGYFPNETSDPEYTQIAAFSEKEEAELIDKLYLYGLFDIDDDYPSPPGISDGGGWHLIIEYRDGTVKRSVGSNNSPSDVFAECAKAFYDICKNGVVGSVPEKY